MEVDKIEQKDLFQIFSDPNYFALYLSDIDHEPLLDYAKQLLADTPFKKSLYSVMLDKNNSDEKEDMVNFIMKHFNGIFEAEISQVVYNKTSLSFTLSLCRNVFDCKFYIHVTENDESCEKMIKDKKAKIIPMKYYTLVKLGYYKEND